MTPLAIPFPQIDPVLFEFGPLVVRWYALAYIAGLILGWRYVASMMEQPRLWGAAGAPATREDIDDLLVWAAFGVILGGRIGYIAFYRADMLLDPMAMLRIWQGGMSFHGGLIGVILAIMAFSLKRGVEMRALGDAVACAAPIGLLFGRIANFINGELWGRATDVPWAMVFPYDSLGLTRHPSQLYEAALEGLVLFLVLRWFSHSRLAMKRSGVVTGVFLAGYGVARAFVELYREPDAHLGYLSQVGPVGVTMGMVLCVPMIILGALSIATARAR